MAGLAPLVEALASGDEERAEAAVILLAAEGRSALNPLLQLANSMDADRRWWAVRALGALNFPESRRAVAAALQDRDVTVRQCAALSLRYHPNGAVIPDLIELLASPDRLLARLAGDAMAALEIDSVDSLTIAARSDSPAVRIEAIRALALMAAPEATGPLFAALDDRSSMVVHWAEQGLERRGLGMTFFRP
jgi:HEAT repeat protein